MKTQELKKELIKEFKASLDPSSKWFSADVDSFNKRLKTENDKERLSVQLGNLRCLNGKSKSFNKNITQIVKELDKGGMFDVGKMKPKNALS